MRKTAYQALDKKTNQEWHRQKKLNGRKMPIFG